MINSTIEKAINQQINQELSAAYNYLGMSAYFDVDNLSGFAHWCKLQHDEEIEHAMRLFQYLLDRGGKVKLETIEAPKSNYKSALDVFKAALKQEEDNTKSIDKLYQQASKEGDHATISHLQWFVDEQVEEEKTVGEIVSLMERAGSDVTAVLYLNDKLALRTAEA